ncbi:large conductance mechanosensitive channel [Metamycoplasma subdolum]|uniref:Large conductance mechanosensitive channel n=1 Tax=Metamycoplasma subdolum TaxID=92407 RepID=A0A3M0A2I6_9BACT|nr:MscL family protein [Metamycoplasma subdolum]RMA79040.1 large conductance mechanosensitive channel [Metamycoplasma subdolum]WPB50563.1 MscL family protein [Metamycoplasma subdolum]
MTKKELEQKKHVVKNAFKKSKEAVIRGNLLILAIGVLLGNAFGLVISSLATDVIMAAIAKIWAGSGDLAKWEVGGIYIGKFLAALVNFVVVAVCIFLGLLIFFTIKNAIEYAKAKRQPIEEEKAPEPTTEELILATLKKIEENTHNTIKK